MQPRNSPSVEPHRVMVEDTAAEYARMRSLYAPAIRVHVTRTEPARITTVQKGLPGAQKGISDDMRAGRRGWSWQLDPALSGRRRSAMPVWIFIVAARCSTPSTARC